MIKYGNIKELTESDILIIGLQEILEMKGKNLTQIIANSNEEAASIWENTLKKVFSNFVLIGSTSMLGLMLIIFQNKTNIKKNPVFIL